MWLDVSLCSLFSKCDNGRLLKPKHLLVVKHLKKERRTSECRVFPANYLSTAGGCEEGIKKFIINSFRCDVYNKMANSYLQFFSFWKR